MPLISSWCEVSNLASTNSVMGLRGLRRMRTLPPLKRRSISSRERPETAQEEKALCQLPRPGTVNNDELTLWEEEEEHENRDTVRNGKDDVVAPLDRLGGNRRNQNDLWSLSASWRWWSRRSGSRQSS